jgi:hypothetical protein
MLGLLSLADQTPGPSTTPSSGLFAFSDSLLAPSTRRASWFLPVSADLPDRPPIDVSRQIGGRAL